MGHLNGVKILVISVNYRRKLFAYMPYLEVRETKYNLRPHPLPVPLVAHAFAESCLLYKLVKIKDELATYHKLIHVKIIERTHSHSGFSNYVVNIMIERYSYECILYPCHTCSRI